MIVVSDTTPINYLVLIKAIDVLPKLFDEIYTVAKVVAELCDPRAPRPVRSWAKSPPPWLKVLDPSSRLDSTARLDAGEADAISLAKEIGAPAVLMDESRGREVAISEGLIVFRTLTLLEGAAENGLIKLKPTLDRLKQTTFRISPDLLDAAVDRYRAKHANKPSSKRHFRPG